MVPKDDQTERVVSLEHEDAGVDSEGDATMEGAGDKLKHLSWHRNR